MPRLESHRGRAEVYSLFAIIGLLLLPVAVLAQGGRASTGTNGVNTILIRAFDRACAGRI